MSESKYLLEPLDHEEHLVLELPADPGFYKAPLLRSLPGRVLKAARLAVGGYPANFVTRAQWGARPPGKNRSTNITPQTGGVAWHYEGPKTGLPSHDKCASRVRQIQAFHMGAQRGWNDIAYSCLVCPHGFIYEGRGLFTRTAANGTNAGNQAYYAICGMMGDGDTLTQSMIEAFKHCTIWMRESGKAGNKVKPHRHFKATGCPGDLIANETAKWDGKVITVTYAPPTPTPAPQPKPVNPDGYRNQTYPAHPAHSMPLVTTKTDTPKWIVQDIQGHLNYAYWDHKVANAPLLKCDGDFGPTSEARLKDWQKRTGLVVDGKVGNDTWNRLHTVTERRRVDATGKAF